MARMNPEGLMEHSGGYGLPEKLPAGERVLWQGAPGWKTLFRHAFHARGVALYFAVIVAWCAGSSVLHGVAAQAILLSTAKLTGLSLVPLALMALYSWGLQRSTVYTITNRRVVMSFGIAVPMTVNLPFSRIEGAGVKQYGNGTGDIQMSLLNTERLAYLMVWPHARPWRMARAEPMLRCIGDVDGAAAVLARALAAQAAIPISAKAGQTGQAAVREATVPGLRVPQAA